MFSDKFDIKLLDEHNPDFRYVIPYKIFDKDNEFTLFAVWTKDKDIENKKIEYTEPIWNAINYDKYKILLDNSVILIGDFNSNNYWDKEYIKEKTPSHNDIINLLKKYKIESTYHKYYHCENGKEKDPTLLWQMDINKKYHIDYCFVSNDFNIKNVHVGNLNEWENTKHSDHCPLIIELEQEHF